MRGVVTTNWTLRGKTRGLSTPGLWLRVIAVCACAGALGCNYLLNPPPEPGTDAGSADAGQVARDAGPPREPDETPPRLTLQTPAEDCLSGDVTFRLLVADDDSQVGFVTARFAGNDLTLQDMGEGVHEATFDADTLFTGFHSFTATALDTANNLAELERTFGHARAGEYADGTTFSCGDPPDAGAPDSEPPTVTILTPPAGLDAYASASLSVGASATDDVGPVTVVAELGGAQTTLAGVADLYNGTLDTSAVAPGEHTLTVTATDAAARSASAQRPVTVDRTAPTVSIVEPLANESRAAFTDVVAEASDDTGITRVSLYEQGVAEPLGVSTQATSGDRYGIIYRLPCAGLPRDVTFEMVARDRAGNEATAAVTVTVETTGCAP